MASRRLVTLPAAALAVGGLLLAGPAAVAAPGPEEVEFHVADVGPDGFTTWTVPYDICAIDIEAAGGDGGRSWVTDNHGTASPGRGAVLTTRAGVAPGSTLTIAVGSSPGDSGTGGAPGGGSTNDAFLGGGGGGWSGVATGAVPAQDNVLIVAAGGGGASNDGGGHGGDADAGSPAAGRAGGASPGTDVAGGVGGAGAIAGQTGTALRGGDAPNGAGGGGAGWFGGGGGGVLSERSGGAGGSSFPFATSADRLSYRIKSGADSAHGWVVVGYDRSDPAYACPPPTAAAVDGEGGALEGKTLTGGAAFTVTGSDWPVGVELTVTFESTPVVLGTVTVAGDGTFSFTGAVPALAEAGPHSVVVTPPSTLLPTFRFGLVVLALPPTGADLTAPAGIAAAMLAAGLALLVARRRRTGGALA